MQLLRRNSIILVLFLLAGCNWFQRTAYFFISNTSEDRKAVDIQVSIGDKTVYNDRIKYTDIAPDLQYTPYVTLPKGKYMMRVTADSGKVSIEHPVDLGTDRWIFVSYSYKAPIDTAKAKILFENFRNDTTWLNLQVRGYLPNVKIHIMDKEPVHM